MTGIDTSKPLSNNYDVKAAQEARYEFKAYGARIVNRIDRALFSNESEGRSGIHSDIGNKISRLVHPSRELKKDAD